MPASSRHGSAQARFNDPEWFVPRLSIVDKEGRVNTLRVMTPEQRVFLREFQQHRNMLVLKPRQMGMTTMAVACLFWLAYTSRDPLGLLSLTHESGACARINMMLRQYWRGLPQGLRPTLPIDNMKEIEFGHNGSVFRQLMAGGRGQGRSFTYQVLHATEMAFWPQGSASAKGTAVDEDVWASVLSTMHDGPHRRMIVESTGDGPSGIFYEMVKTAQRSDDWKFLFYRWFDIDAYAIDPAPGWERTSEEQELAAEFGVNDRQLAWRRRKILDQGYSVMRFRREYPSTWQEPFLLADSTWFDAELLNRVLGRLPPEHSTRGGALHLYHQPDPYRKYFIGMDTSGGTGGDYAVIVVLRDDMEIVATWKSNTTAPHLQADKAAELSAHYGRAEVLCEENNYGRAVIERMEKLRVRVWKNDRNKNFWTQGGKAGATKKMVYTHARQLVNEQHSCSAGTHRPPGINDPQVLHELIIVREGRNGNIEAPEGQHDDHADAYVLALWCGRGHYIIATDKPAEDPEEVKMRRARAALRRMR